MTPSQFLLEHQGMLEDFGLLAILVGLVILFVVYPMLREQAPDDLMDGTWFARDHRRRTMEATG